MQGYYMIVLMLLLCSCHSGEETSRFHSDSSNSEVSTRAVVKDSADGKELIRLMDGIRVNVKRIDAIRNWTDTIGADLETSTEGGDARFYYMDKRLEKIITHEFGESFQLFTGYYLLDEELSFTYEKRYQYNRPITHDSVTMKETGDTEVFDFKKSTITEQRTFFTNQKIIYQSVKVKEAPAHEAQRLINQLTALKKIVNL